MHYVSIWNGFLFYCLTYHLQLSELIEYFNDLFRSLPTFQINDCKVHIDLDDFPSLSKKTLSSIFTTNYVFLLE
jgi:hypothetical protein